LSWRLFDILGAQEWASLKSYKGTHGTLADGLCIPFDGIITLPGRVCDQAIYQTLIISHLKEDAIRRMLFLEKHQHHMNFRKSAVVVEKELACVEKFSRPLVGGVQVVRDYTVPRRPQATLRCKINCKEIIGLGVGERMHRAIRLANSLNWLDCRRELFVQCMNPFMELVRLLAGVLVGKKAYVGPALGAVADTQRNLSRTSQEAVPEHCADLYGGACENFASSTEGQVLAQLLMKFNDVFSRCDGNMGLTEAISHEIPLAAGTAPIRQPTRHLGRRKKRT